MSEKPPLMENPQETIEDVYILSYNTSSMITRHKEARREFVEGTAQFIVENTPKVNDVEAEMLAEDLLDEVFGDLISHIEEEGVSLWFTLKGKDGKSNLDFPVYTRSPVGAFNSIQGSNNPTIAVNREDPSEAFFEAISSIVDTDGDNDWGGVPEDTWYELSEIEQEIVLRVKFAIIEMINMTPEISLLVEYSKYVTDK